MSRIIKFRVFDTILNKFVTFHQSCTRFEDEELIFQQFTGLLDKNNKEIYEGDLVTFFSLKEIVYKVYYSSNVCQFRLKNFNNTTQSFDGENSNQDIHIEVIGNIFENPEPLSK